MKARGWLTWFPLLELLIPSTLNHRRFPQGLKFSSTFRKHELHKQAAVLALLLGSPQVCVGEHMRVRASHASL